MRALRADNARLEARVEKLEEEMMLRKASASSERKPLEKEAPMAAGDPLPALTVVKLKPRRDPAPKLDTQVSVSEPPDALLQEIQNDRTSLPDETTLALAEAQFERALGLMKTGNSPAGVVQMQQFVSDWPKHPQADNALYLAGLALLTDKEFEAAAVQFERVINHYPAGDAVLDSMLRLAECRLKLNRPIEARATWERIVTGFPGTAAATQAQARLASLSKSSAGSP